ncbi:ABC-F type ribosomal protection protein [Oceanobacillus sp. FSL K6-2867]|uniref:Msr family ABC-F type ribosomal protection protein n=1 Tax=Oceanobacillus sp. FSL K6-2867 TaxID=2954748 RepID=UPI0030DA3126
MEKICLELENIELIFYDQVILDIPRLAVHQFDRIGIVGQNGAGKSTLLKLLHGQIQPDKGKVHRFADFAYFDQLAKPAEKEADYELLGKLAVPSTDISHLSGGEQTRMKLAQLFSTYQEGLLIDEPTTHLDTAGTTFLIEELTYYYGALVLVSHDRFVLDKLITKVWEIEGGKITEYTGNYSDYVAQKELQRTQQYEQHEKYVKEKDRLLKAAEEKMKKAEKITEANKRISKKGTKAMANRMFETKSKGTSQKAVQRAAKGIERRVEQLKTVEAPDKERALYFHQSAALKLHNKFPIMADQLTLEFGKNTLLKDASFQFSLGSTIAITGKNGSGKTTLLQHILQHGEGISISPKAVIGAYYQMSYQFEKDETILAYMKQRSDYDEGKIRAALHAMNFTGNDLKKKTSTLSGGETIRLLLCQLFLGRYNILILDEPTNFLDIFCIEALEKFLKAYKGTVILVSHDRTFTERVADTVYILESQQLKILN